MQRIQGVNKNVYVIHVFFCHIKREGEGEREKAEGEKKRWRRGELN